MKKQIKLLLITILTVTICIAALCLTACFEIPSDDTDKSNLEVKYDNSHIVNEGDSLDSLKPYLTVEYTDKKGSKTTVTEYELAGTLTKGESTVTVRYNNLTATCKITVLEQITTNTYTVTFKADGSIVGTQTYTAENKTITVPNVPGKTGYDGQWEQYTLTTGDLTVNAVYTAKQYAITLNYDGATGGNTQQTITVTYDQPVGILPEPTKDNYEFAGWKHNNVTVTTSMVWQIDDNAVFIAQWNKIYTPTEGLAYKLNSDGESYSVTGIGTATDTDIVINSIYNDKPVTSIEESAFADNKSITSITIPDCVISIGDYAFLGCSSIENITVSSGNAKYRSAGNCLIETETKTLILGCNNSIIPNDGSIAIIGAGSFYDCRLIESITIPNGVLSIGQSTFANCSSLTKITLPDSLIDIDNEGPFDGCEKLQYNEYDNALYLGNESNPYVALVKAKSKDISSCIINNGTKVIVEAAFSQCNKLTALNIPNGVTSIGCYAFSGCNSLADISIPDSLMIIGYEHVFTGCPLKYNEYDNVLYLGNEINPYVLVIGTKSNDITSCTINEKAKVISCLAFYSCNSLKTITMGNGVTSICGCSSTGAFRSLERINFNGTKDEWKAIKKVYNWGYSTGNYTVFCTDGSIADDGTETNA